MPLDISQTKTRTLIFGAVFAAATVLSGNFAAAGAAGLVIQAIGGIAGNIGASDLGDMIKCFRQNQKILDDPHLTLAVGRAISLVILNVVECDDELPKLVENKRLPYPFDSLRKLAKNTETKWVKLSKKTISNSDYIDIHESQLVTMFANDVQKFHEIKALDIAAWEQILCWLASESRVSLHQDVIKYVAQKLYDEFPQRFRDVLKHNADNGGEAFALMLLNLHGEALSALKELKKENQQIIDALEEIAKRKYVDIKQGVVLDSQYLEEIKKNTQEAAGIIPDFDLLRYQEAIKERYGKLQLDSLDTSGYAYNELKLWRIFITQNVREVHEILPQLHELPKEHLKRLQENKQLDEEIKLEDLEDYKKIYFEQPIRSVLEIINNKQTYKYIVILGDPGSGKSTLLQYLALNWAESPLNNSISQPIPLLIELRTYMRQRDNQECKNFLEFFHKSPGVVHHFNQHQLQTQLKAGNALMMLDGLDEVFDVGKREDVITDIHRFTKEYPNIQVIVTSRVIGYKPQRLRDAQFKHFMLQDLEGEEIEDFIYRWHELTFNDEVDKIRKKERLQRAIDNSKAIRELAANPLLLTMMAILNRNQELPRDRAELYNQSSRVLLHQWDVERALVEDKRLDPKTIDYKDKQAMLRQVAYLMQTSDKGLAGNLIKESDLEKVLTDYFKSIEFEKARAAAKLMINQLRSRNFMLCYLGADYYAFVHRTFLEYFCAYEYVWQFKETQTLTIEELKTEVFGKHWMDESWHEVLRLIAGMINSKFVGEIIEYLIEVDGQKEGYLNLLVAAECFSEVRNRLELISIYRKLIDIPLEVSHNFNWSYDIKEEKLVGFKLRTSLARFVSIIVKLWNDYPETSQWLKSNIKLPANSDIKSQLNLQLGAEVRAASLQELVNGWKNDFDILGILKACAQYEYDIVRCVAILELARSWKDDPDCLSIIKKCAKLNDNFFGAPWLVRDVALRALSEYWKDEPEIFEFLYQCALFDPFDKYDTDIRFPSPRGSALTAILNNYPEHPQTLPLLHDRAENDPDEKLREFAQSKLKELKNQD